jgi:hypothetical protein
VKIAPIGGQLNPAFNSSRSFFVDTPKKVTKQGRVTFLVRLDSPSCTLRPGEVVGEIRLGKKKVTDVFWASESSGPGDVNSCWAATREALQVKKTDRYRLFVEGRQCTTFRGSYLLRSDNPQIFCNADSLRGSGLTL